MKKPTIGIIIFGWIEILTLLTTIVTLLRIERYPLVLLFWPTPIAILGVFTIRLKPLARRINLFLSPLIVITYVCAFMMILEGVIYMLGSSLKLAQVHFGIVFTFAFLAHIFFFTRPAVKEQFAKIKGSDLNI